jgi:DNA polymerase-3 subunit gamma/tau
MMNHTPGQHSLDQHPTKQGGSLAVLYRPHRFADVVGQRHVKVPLMRAAAAGSLPQQILLSGGSGLGKTTLARICAATLLCETSLTDRPDGDCCGMCRSCKDITSGSHPDVVEIDAASNGRVDEIRELASRAQLAPMRGKFRVYIIDEAHGLSAAGGQAFLKLLEEPPSHVVFMLATTDPEKMLHTNRSRCTQFELAPPSNTDLAENLVRVMTAEGLPGRPDVAKEVIDASDPELGVRGTLMSLEKILPVLRTDSGLPVDTVSELLGRPSQKRILHLLRALVAGEVEIVVSGYFELRSSFPRAQLLARLAASFSTELAAAALDPARRQDLPELVAASDELSAARRDDSDLATVAMLVKLATRRPRIALPTDTEDRPVNNTPPVPPDAPAVVTRPATSPTSTKEVSSAPVPVEPVEMSVPKPPAEPPAPSDIVEFIYANDPFNSPESPSPEPETTPAADALEMFNQLLERLSSLGTPRSRLITAKLRPARPTTDANGLLLRLPTAASTGVVSAPEFIEATAALGFAVNFTAD